MIPRTVVVAVIMVAVPHRHTPNDGEKPVITRPAIRKSTSRAHRSRTLGHTSGTQKIKAPPPQERTPRSDHDR